MKSIFIHDEYEERQIRLIQIYKIFALSKMDLSEWLKNEEVQKQLRKVSGMVSSAVYNEVYLYLWFICIYNIFLLGIVVLNLYLLLKLIRLANAKTVDISGFA